MSLHVAHQLLFLITCKFGAIYTSHLLSGNFVWLRGADGLQQVAEAASNEERAIPLLAPLIHPPEPGTAEWRQTRKRRRPNEEWLLTENWSLLLMDTVNKSVIFSTCLSLSCLFSGWHRVKTEVESVILGFNYYQPWNNIGLTHWQTQVEGTGGVVVQGRIFFIIIIIIYRQFTPHIFQQRITYSTIN